MGLGSMAVASCPGRWDDLLPDLLPDCMLLVATSQDADPLKVAELLTGRYPTIQVETAVAGWSEMFRMTSV
jgi:hypothetical protein